MIKCPKCSSQSIVKNGMVKRKQGLSQRFKCKACRREFIRDDGFKQYRTDPKIITAALDLRAKGLSLRDIVDHLDQHHKVIVSRKTILDWQKKFGKKLKSFTQSLIPFLGKVFHADEMFVKERKNWIYYWDCIDYNTKFIVADHLSNERNFDEGTKFLNKIKKGSPEIPLEIHTDNSFDYPIAFRRVFPRKKIHKHYPAWKMKFKNNPIERLHNTLKQRYKVFRGFHSIETAEDFFDFYTIYYNFIRKHMTLGNITPAQAAKIILNLKKNRFLSLIKLILAFYKARFAV